MYIYTNILYTSYNIIDLSFGDIASIKCAAHTLQLAVKDAFKDEEFDSAICQARAISKLLRTPLNRYIIIYVILTTICNN